MTNTIDYNSDFYEFYEVSRSVVMSNRIGTYRVDILKHQVEERDKFIPRIYKQDAVIIQERYKYVKDTTDNAISASDEQQRINWKPAPSEFLIWREYEMSFKPVDYADEALRLAISVIKADRGR